MSIELISRDIYLRHTDGNGHSVVRCHRVWDADRFVASLQALAKKEAERAFAKDEPYMHKVEQITDDQFKKERK